MLSFKYRIILVSLASIITTMPMESNASATAPVSGFALSFLLSTPISNATITVLETGDIYKTDSNGKYGPFQYPVGKPITLVFSKWGYKTIQSGTVVVPTEGLTTPYSNITFQIPSVPTYYVLKAAVGAKSEENACHVTSTVTAYHKTLNDVPQGEEGTEVMLTPNVNIKPFYFDVFKSGPLKDYTNPFTRTLTATSKDGGIAYFNLPPSDQPYTLSAVKKGVVFSEAQFLCRKGALINISPPRGPSAQASKI